MEWRALTSHQRKAVRAAWEASDGWLVRGASRIWIEAPMAIMALERKGVLAMPRRRDRARLTEQGLAIAEAQFGEQGR